MRYVLAEPRIGIGQDFRISADGSGMTTFSIRHQQVEGLLRTETVISDIIPVQAGGLVIRCGGTVRANGEITGTTCGVLAVLPSTPEHAYVAEQGHHHSGEAKTGALRKTAELSIAEGTHPLGQHEKRQHHH